MQPREHQVHASPGPTNLKATVQYQNGTPWPGCKDRLADRLRPPLQEGPERHNHARSCKDPGPAAGLQNEAASGSSPAGSAGSINELRVSASPAGPVSSTPRIVISYPRDGEYFGRTAYIQGFANAPASNANGTAQVSFENKTSANSDGAFSLSLTKDETRFYSQPDDEAGPAREVGIRDPRRGVSLNLLSKNSGGYGCPRLRTRRAGEMRPLPTTGRSSRTRWPRARPKRSSTRASPSTSRQARWTRRRRSPSSPDRTRPCAPQSGDGQRHLPRRGYRFLPHGMKFLKPIKINPSATPKQLFAAGQADNEVNMY